MANGLKYSITTETETLRKGNFWLAVGDVQKPFGTYYTAIVPPSGGYSIYQNKASDGPAIYVANSDAELIQYTKLIMGTTFATGPSALDWYNSQTDKMVANIEYPQIKTNGLILNLDAEFTPSYPRGGTTWYDVGPTAYSTKLFNSPSFSSSATGGGAFTFDGTDDYVLITPSTPSSLLGNPAFSVEGWFKAAGTWSNGSTWGIGGNGSTQGINSWNSASVNHISIDLLGTSTYSTNRTYSLNSWNHIVWTYNGGGFTTSNITIYIDGIPYTGSSLSILRGGSGTPNINSTGVVLGRAGATVNDYYSKPIISNFRIYSNVLSQTEVTKNYQVFLPRFLGQNIVTNGMVQYLNAGYPNSYPGSGTTWTNVAGVSGGNGTLRNTPTYSSSNGGSIVFDGGDDYVEFLSSPTNVVTVSIWANLGTSGNFPLILAGNTLQYDSNLWNWSMYTYLGNFYVRGNAGSLGLISTPASTLVNKWMNWVLVRNDGTNTCRVYLNGNLFGTSNEVSSTDGTLSLGRGGNYLNGKVSNFQIYNRPLTASEVLQNYQASLPQILAENIVTSGMVAYYDAGYSTSYGGTGTVWTNVAGTPGGTGTLTNGPTYATGNGGAINFDGSDDFVEYNSIPSINGISNFTFSISFRSSQNKSYVGLFGEGPGPSYTLELHNGFLRWWVSGSTIDTPLTYNDDKWYIATITQDGSGNYKCYVNGQQVVTGVQPSLTLSGNRFAIASWNNISYTFQGKIAFLMIYGRVLNSFEILQNYNAQKSRFGL